MSKIVVSKYKASRKLGGALWGTEKDAYNNKPYPPGQHKGRTFGKISEYGLQLKAKQRFMFYYNMRQKQFKRFFNLASGQKGNVAENIVGLLERRLDTVVYRSGFVRTIFASCQLVGHGHVLVNNKPVNIRSYLVKEGDVISLTDTAQKMEIIRDALVDQEREVPSYISTDDANHAFTFLRIPASSEVPYSCVMEMNLVVELFSR